MVNDGKDKHIFNEVNLRVALKMTCVQQEGLRDCFTSFTIERDRGTAVFLSSPTLFSFIDFKYIISLLSPYSSWFEGSAL